MVYFSSLCLAVPNFNLITFKLLIKEESHDIPRDEIDIRTCGVTLLMSILIETMPLQLVPSPTVALASSNKDSLY